LPLARSRSRSESWTRSASDQAVFATGGDVQVNLPAQLEPGGAGAVTDARGVTHSLAVAADIQASPGEVIAVDSARAPDAEGQEPVFTSFSHDAEIAS
jgi:hypothetical protein